MKNIILYPLLIIFLSLAAFTNCNTNDTTPVYDNFQNDLEAKNLYGNVKSIKLYKQGTFDDSPSLKTIESYNKEGNLESFKQLDSDGTTEESKILSYDKNGHPIKVVTKDFVFESERTMVIIPDTIHKTYTYQAFEKDQLVYKHIETHDDFGNIITAVETMNGETTSISYTYTFNEQNAIIEMHRTEGNETTLLKKNTYDAQGNRTEALIFDTYLTHKELSEYKGDKLYKVIESHITKRPEEFIDREVIYDERFNPIHEKIYRENKLITEHKITYEFDDQNNWIKKTVDTKDYIFDEEEGFQFDYTETRDIKYWK